MPYHELTTAMGVPELTPIICQIDNAAFNSYMPDEVCSRGAARDIGSPTAPNTAISNGISSEHSIRHLAPSPLKARLE